MKAALQAGSTATGIRDYTSSTTPSGIEERATDMVVGMGENGWSFGVTRCVMAVAQVSGEIRASGAKGGCGLWTGWASWLRWGA